MMLKSVLIELRLFWELLGPIDKNRLNWEIK